MFLREEPKLMILKETTHQTLRVEKCERRSSGVWRKRRIWRTWNIQHRRLVLFPEGSVTLSPMSAFCFCYSPPCFASPRPHFHSHRSPGALSLNLQNTWLIELRPGMLIEPAMGQPLWAAENSWVIWSQRGRVGRKCESATPTIHSLSKWTEMFTKLWT